MPRRQLCGVVTPILGIVESLVRRWMSSSNRRLGVVQASVSDDGDNDSTKLLRLVGLRIPSQCSVASAVVVRSRYLLQRNINHSPVVKAVVARSCGWKFTSCGAFPIARPSSTWGFSQPFSSLRRSVLWRTRSVSTEKIGCTYYTLYNCFERLSKSQ